ncbi:MAG: alpha/beta fold hydrolase [Gallionella sp.]
MKGTWLNKPSEGRVAVIFIHGIFSSSADCWTHSNGTHWPTQLANENGFSKFGIYNFEYKTDFFSGHYSLNDVVDALKEKLALDSVSDCETLIFVCHSMGGIVARKYVVQNAAHLERTNKKIGLFLIASPSLGSNYANWLAPLAKFFKHSQARALRFQEDNIWLNGLDSDFINLKEDGHLQIKGKELVEDTFIVLPKFLVFRQVVPPFAGAKYFGDAIKIPNSDHFSIAKIENGNDTKHQLLLKFLSSYLPEEWRNAQEPDSVGISLRFSDKVNADIVSCRLAVEKIAKTEDKIEIEWPEQMGHYENTLRQFLVEIPKYLEKDSMFFGSNANEISDMAASIRSTLGRVSNIKEFAALRARCLVKSMIPYWGVSWDAAIGRSLANYLTLANAEVIREMISYFRGSRDLNLYNEYFPKEYEGWFASDYINYRNDFYKNIFPIEHEMCSVKLRAISGTNIEMGAWFWGATWEVVASARWREGEALQGNWFKKYLIPQNELRLAFLGSDEVFRYNEKVNVIKITNSSNEEIY